MSNGTIQKLMIGLAIFFAAGTAVLLLILRIFFG